jgi:hypothetical protein
MFTRMPHAPKRRRRQWQPKLPAAVEAEGQPLAAHVGAHPEIESVAELSYIAVDEIGDTLVTLLVSGWPELDESGRLRFPESEPIAVDVDRAALTGFLAENRVPEDLARRRLREGDAFAARTRRTEGLESAERRDPAHWMLAPLYDVTADARDAAKAAFFGVVGTPLPPDLAAALEAQGGDREP